MIRIVKIILLVLIAILGLSFFLLNTDQVSIDFYFAKLQASLAALMVVSLALGALLGALAVMGKVLSLKHEISRRDKKLKLTEKELDNLRSLPLRDE